MDQLSPQELKTLMGYLIEQINERGGIPIKTQLVKILYLVDLEHYRSRKKTLTGLPWIFYHYGPYTSELEPIISSLGIADIESATFFNKKGNRGFTYTGGFNSQDETESDFTRKFKNHTKLIIDRILDQWALEDLWILLDYVYYETEPMRDVKRGELLDFTKVTNIEQPIYQKAINIDSVTLTNLKKRLLQNKKGKVEQRIPSPPPLDDIYDEALAIMNSEERRN
jgi:hypothetical protein